MTVGIVATASARMYLPGAVLIGKASGKLASSEDTHSRSRNKRRKEERAKAKATHH